MGYKSFSFAFSFDLFAVVSLAKRLNAPFVIASKQCQQILKILIWGNWFFLLRLNIYAKFCSPRENDTKLYLCRENDTSSVYIEYMMQKLCLPQKCDAKFCLCRENDAKLFLHRENYAKLFLSLENDAELCLPLRIS